jgi:glucose/arabinose dehydrogenase
MRGVEAYRALQGTRFAEHRSVVSWPVPVGESNNIVLAPDGRLLVGISAPCDHCRPTSPWSAAIVSFRPDGSDLGIFASGIRAPFGLTYYPGTDDLFVSMDQRDDLGARTPGDWLSVVTQGQNWRFPDCYGQKGSSCTGVAKPTAVLDKHAAVGGVAIVTGQLCRHLRPGRGVGVRKGPARRAREDRVGLFGTRPALSYRHEESTACSGHIRGSRSHRRLEDRHHISPFEPLS